MPNFVKFEGINSEDSSYAIKDFSRKEAEDFAELMKQEFIKHWESKQTKLKSK